jgi:nucleoside-diphosphate-sugar epimerase
MNKVCLIGARGNLGEVLRVDLISSKYDVENIVSGDDIADKLNAQKYDLIINAANKYYVQPNKFESREMEEGIIQVAQSIVDSKAKASLIFFSSYLQYLPDRYQPWSEYSILKNRAVEIYRKYAEKNQLRVVEIVLYDTYGGRNKSKFFDLVLKSAATGVPLQATPGASVLNLTHVNEISSSVISLIENTELFSNNGFFSTFAIYSNNVFTLKELVFKISQILKINVPILWGEKPYREKEVFQFYKNKPLLPTFFQSTSIDQYILSQFQALKT